MTMILAQIDPVLGGYISIIKLAALVVLFFLWMPLINWIHSDAQEVRADVRLWTSLATALGAGCLILWLLIPLFVFGLLIFIVCIGGISLAYIIHRNSRVAEFEKVLTLEHFKSIFVNEEKKMQKASRGMHFITANNNEVPLPEPKSPEAYGFRVACDLLEDALWKRASQIQMLPTKENYVISYVIDGIKTKQESQSREDVEYLIRYLKQLADLEVQERRKPQSGPFKVNLNGDKTDWRVTTAGSTAGEHVKIDKLEEYNLMTLDDLGLFPDQVESLKTVRERKQGLVIISGPKGSGLTSTFYAMIKNHDPFMNNINTLEKKPSTELQNITQNTYTLTDTGTTTYARKLQTVIRRGPDILGIGECEDAQTAQLATRAANDGKVVHAVIEAGSVLAALQKWLKFVEDRERVANALIGILNQRLVRKLCDQCKEAYKPNPQLLRKFNLPADKIKLMYRPGQVEYDKKGNPILCEKCQGTGYYGRVGIFETIIINDQLRDFIKNAKSIQEIGTQFRKTGMLLMQEQSIRKVAKGVTSINEVVREFANSSKQPPKANVKPKS